MGRKYSRQNHSRISTCVTDLRFAAPSFFNACPAASKHSGLGVSCPMVVVRGSGSDVFTEYGVRTRATVIVALSTRYS